jgi:hypothetical protein
LNPEYDKVLNEEANRQGLSVSALLNQIIRQYTLVSRFTQRIPAITLTYHTFAPLLECIPDNEIVEVAEKTGAIIPEEAILQRGRHLTLDTVNWLIDVVYGRYANWFDSNQSIINGEERIHLAHQLNHKWSQYLGGYMNSMFNSTLDIQPKVETRANSVTLYIKKPKSSSINK